MNDPQHVPSCSEPQLVKVKLISVVRDPKTDTPLVILREEHGERYLPIWVGELESDAIQGEVERAIPPRVFPHELISQRLTLEKSQLRYVVIVGLKDKLFTAKFVVGHPGEVDNSSQMETECRPADAIALAVRFRVPIFAAEHLFDATSKPDSGAKQRRGTILAAGLLLIALALVVIYTNGRAFRSPLALVVVAAIGLAALLLQLRLRQDIGTSVRSPILLNVLGLVFAILAVGADYLHLGVTWMLLAAGSRTSTRAATEYWRVFWASRSCRPSDIRNSLKPGPRTTRRRSILRTRSSRPPRRVL